MPDSNRVQYRKEYDDLIVRRKAVAFKAIGFLQALVKMDDSMGPATRKFMASIVDEYNKIDQEIDHLSSLLDLIDHNENTDFGEW
tara:strand:- start:737 stop:991 length:255 start_codon:yes stop_codon:yes gene_type:complete